MNDDIVDWGQFRRGALFLVNIGVPVIIGLLRHQPDAALLGAVVGMLLAFADNDRELPGRLRLLALDAVMIAGGGIIGRLCRDSAPALWAVFVAITLSVGMAARGGREALVTGRHCAMAFTVAAGHSGISELSALVSLRRYRADRSGAHVDHLLSGPLPLQPAAPLQMPSGQSGWFALRWPFPAQRSPPLDRTRRSIRSIPSGSSPPHSSSCCRMRGRAIAASSSAFPGPSSVSLLRGSSPCCFVPQR